MPSPTPFTITELPTLTAEEAQARAKRAEARLQAPDAVRAQPALQEAPAPPAQPAPPKPQAPPHQVFTLEQGLPRDLTPKPLSPNQTVKQAVASNLAMSRTAPEAVRGMAAPMADEETQRLLQRQMELRVSSRDRAAAFLRERGYDEAVSLLPDGINLSDTRKKMEAAGLQRKARELGHNNWFEVPAGPARDQAQKDVAAGVEQDLRRATTVGRGAIFIDPDPAGTRAAIANAPLPLRAKMALTALVPTAKATYSPTGAEFQTESPLGYLMRPVNAIGSVTVAPVEEMLETAQPLKRIAQNRQAWDAGEVSTERYLDELKSIASDSFRAATGIDPEKSGKDWRDILVDDPKAQQALIDRVGTDPAAMVVGDQIADDLTEYYGAPSALTHLLFIPAGFGVDLLTPDPVGLGLAAAGAGAAKAGARLAGDSDDLVKAARDMRTAAAQEGATLDSTLQAARGSYNGLDQALALRVGARARVPTDVAAQVRRLETETVAAQLAAAKAEERATEASGEADQFRAAQDVLKSKRDAAKAALAEAETKAALADEGLDLYKKVGAPAVKKSEQLLKASDEATQEARLIEDEIAHVEATHQEVLQRLDTQNDALRESLSERQTATEKLAESQQAILDGLAAKAKPAEMARLRAERDAAKVRLKELEREVKDLHVTQRRAMKDAEGAVAELRQKGTRALELHTRAAEMEQESAEGIRRITVGQAIPDLRTAIREVGQRTEVAREAAQRALAGARDDFRMAARAAGQGDVAAERAAEEEIKRIEGMMNTQMKADLLRERSILWKEEANKLADEIERGVASLRAERKVNPRRDGILTGTVLDEIPISRAPEMSLAEPPHGWGNIETGAAEDARPHIPFSNRRPPKADMASWRTADDAAQWIAENSDVSAYRHIAKKLMPAVKHADFELVNSFSHTRHEGVAGVYNNLRGARPAIQMMADTATEDTLLHELVHAATTERMRTAARMGMGTAEGRATKRLLEIHAEAKVALDSLEASGKIDEYVASGARYGTSNIDEFIAEALSDPDFQHLLTLLPSATPKRSLWSGFVDGVRQLLGFGRIADRTAMDDVAEAFEHVLRAPYEPRGGPTLPNMSRADAGYVVDTAAFRSKMAREYGEDAVRWWVERAGDDRDLWTRALGFRGSHRTITKKEAVVLQQGERGILEGIKRTRGEAAAEAQVEALLQLRRDPAYKAADFQGTTTQKWMRHINDSLEVWVNALDPTAARIGDVGKDLLEISKAGNRICNNMGDELLMLGRLARQPRGVPGMYRTALHGFGGPQDMIDVTFRYIDSTEPIQVFGRKTISNTGDETLWGRGQRQFMTDPRVATHEALLANAKTQGVSVEEFLRSEAPGVANRPLLGLSRMWLKSGVGASERQSAYLFGEAKRLVAETGSYREFAEEMKKATQRAWTNDDMTAGGGFGPGAVEVHPQLAIGYGARCVAQAAAQADINDLFVRGLGGLFTAQEAEDAIRAATYNYDVIENPANVWEVYGRLSAPFTQRSIRDAESAVARTQKLIKTGSTRSGDAVFMLASQARELDNQIGNVVKEVHAQYGQARDINTALKLKHVKDFNQLWKTSVTLGLLVPRPSYFITNIFGNFSQMWLSGGIGQAARISFQSLPFGVPFIGEGLDKGMRMMSGAVGDVPFLGSMTNAWINPHLNRVFAGEQGFFKSKGGIDYDFDTVRKWLVEDGITTTYMQEEFGRLFARAQGGSIWTKASFLQDDIFSWAGEIEVRMRSALYMDYLQKGATRGEARDNTLRALYDWNGALGSTEANVFTWFIPFYRFIKLGVRQFAEEALSLPLRQPGEAAYKALVGQSGLARVNQQMKLTTIPELADDGNYENEQAKYDAMARYRDLDYLNKRVTWSERNDPETVEMYQETRGQSLPYSSIALPGMTALDMGALAVLPFYAAAVVAAKAEGLAGGDADRYLAPDWSTAFLDAAMSMSGPLTQPMIGAWGQAMGASSPRLAESVRLKPGEEAVANFPWKAKRWAQNKLVDLTGWEAYRAQDLGLPATVGKDYQSVTGTAVTKAIVGSIPGLLQVPPMLDAFYYENPHLSHVAFTPEGAHATADYFAFGARQWSGAGRQYPYDPDQIVTQRQRDVGTTMRKAAEAQGAQLREKQIPKP